MPPNESLANLYIGPMSSDNAGTPQIIQCVDNFSVSLPGAAGSYEQSPDLDQNRRFDGFHPGCCQRSGCLA